MAPSKRIEEIFEECLERVFNGESVDQSIKNAQMDQMNPEQIIELRKLLETAVAAKKAATIDPSAEFRERTRLQLQSALRETAAKKAANKAANREEKRPVFSWNWQPRWAVALAAFLVLLVGGSGTVLASSNSMPGQPLYAVKLTSEKVKLAMTTSSTAKAEVYAGLAERRVNEIIYLAENNEPKRIEQVTKNLDLCLTNISNLSGGLSENTLLTARNSDNAKGAGEVSGYGATTIEQDLTAPAAQTSNLTDTRVPAPDSPATITIGGSKSTGSFQESYAPVYSNDVTAADDKLLDLKLRVYYQSVEYPELLKKALENTDPDTRLALLQAIAVSQTGYEKILQTLQYNH
jgi:hypothetical protein